MADEYGRTREDIENYFIDPTDEFPSWYVFTEIGKRPSKTAAQVAKLNNPQLDFYLASQKEWDRKREQLIIQLAEENRRRIKQECQHIEELEEEYEMLSKKSPIQLKELKRKREIDLLLGSLREANPNCEVALENIAEVEKNLAVLEKERKERAARLVIIQRRMAEKEEERERKEAEEYAKPENVAKRQKEKEASRAYLKRRVEEAQEDVDSYISTVKAEIQELLSEKKRQEAAALATKMKPRLLQLRGILSARQKELAALK